MRFFKPFGIPAVEGVQRHPVGALYEDILPVYADPEFARVARQHPVHQLRLSQAYGLFPAVEKDIILIQFQLHLVEICLPVTLRVPEPCGWDLYSKLICREKDLLLRGKTRSLAILRGSDAPAGQLHHVTVRLPVIRRKTPFTGKEGGTIVPQADSRIIRLRDPLAGTLFERHAAPQARGGKPGHDVPSEGMRRLPLPDVFLMAVISADAHGIILFPGPIRGRADEYLQHILPSAPQLLRYIKIPFDQSIVRFTDRNTVQVYLRVCIDPAEMQHRLFRRKIRRDREAAYKAPHIELILPVPVQIRSEKRIRLYTRAAQIQLHAAGHQRFNTGSILREFHAAPFPCGFGSVV